MKIMFCLGSMAKGGAERVVANLANDFIKNNDISIVITKPEQSSYELDNRIVFKTLDSIIDKKTNVLSRNIRRVRKLKKIIKEINPDIIIALIPEPTQRVMLATYFSNRKVIISVRNDPNVEYNSVLKRMIMKLLFRRANGFIFQTEDAKMFFSKKIQRKSVVIPNPINENFVCKPFTGIREKEIVTVGRLVEQKNHKLLVESFSDVSKKHPDYVLKIFGEGVLRDELEKIINELGLNDKVKLMGESNNIKDSIYKSSLFVLSSNYEGMPNALMEAMALGIPCISTDCPIGGPKYLINNNDNGLLVSVNNKEELTNAINNLIENKDLSKKLGKQANKICNELNPKKISSMWQEFILKVLDK